MRRSHSVCAFEVTHDHEVGVHEVVDALPAGGEEVGLALQRLGPVEPAAEGLEPDFHAPIISSSTTFVRLKRAWLSIGHQMRPVLR